MVAAVTVPGLDYRIRDARIEVYERMGDLTEERNGAQQAAIFWEAERDAAQDRIARALAVASGRGSPFHRLADVRAILTGTDERDGR